MFPHDVTIYRHKIVNGEDVITRRIVSGVYWYGGSGATASGKGAVEENSAVIISSPEATALYGTVWDVEPKDRICKGIFPEVTSLKDINGLTVVKVEANICGSTVDNVTITAR